MVRDKRQKMMVYSMLASLGGQFIPPDPGSKPLPDLLPTEAARAIMVAASEKRARKNAKRLRERP